MNKIVLLPLILLLIPLVFAAEGYVINPIEDTNNSYNTTGPMWNITIQPQYIIGETLWQVKHGQNNSNIYNITIGSNCSYNKYLLYLRIVTAFDDGPNTGSSQPQCHNGSEWLDIGTYTSGYSSYDSLVSYNNNWFDDDYTTSLVYDRNQASYTIPNINNNGAVYETDVYFKTGDLQDIVFTVKNEFGRVIEGATVNLQRLADNNTYKTTTTDLSGQVLYEDVNRNYWFLVNVSAEGYNSFSGNVNVIDTSYTITLSSSGVGGSTYYAGLFNNISLLTSPNANPSNTLTNFTIQINSSDEQLEYWGVYTNFNGTTYINNNTVIGGGNANITVDLTNQSGKTILVSYYFKKTNSSLYSQNQYFMIGNIGNSNTSIIGLDEDFSDEFDSAATSIILMIVIILVAGLFSAAGVPGSVTAIITLPILIASAIFGWLDPVISGMAIMIIIGILIIQNKGGL